MVAQVLYGFDIYKKAKTILSFGSVQPNLFFFHRYLSNAPSILFTVSSLNRRPKGYLR